MHESMTSRLRHARRVIAAFRARPGRERGQVVALFALFLVVFLGFAALTIDYGSWLKVRRDYQNVVDSAVLAGSGFLGRPIDATKREQARRAAWESINNQLGLGLSNGQLNTLQASNTPAGSPSVLGDYRIWVSTPPIGAGARYLGGFTGANDRYLFAFIERENASYFSRIFGQGDRTISAWATAGVFTNRYAVITLRQNGQDGPSNATDILLAGSNSALEVVDGDVGGNWGMKLNSLSQLWIHGAGGSADGDVFLVDYITCGSSCWSPDQINVGPPTGTPIITPQQLPTIIDDPNYPLPGLLTGLPNSFGMSGPLQRGGGTSGSGDLRIRHGAVSGAGCDPDSPHIGPGWYHDLRIDAGNCLVLDPTHTYTDPDNADPALRGQTNLPATQQPGIFYITGNLDVQTNALVVGDGVSVFFRPNGTNGQFQPSGGGVMDLNTGKSNPSSPPDMRKAAYMTDGNYTYGWNAGLGEWVYNTSLNTDSSRTGIAIYVAKPSQLGIGTVDANTNVIKVQAGSGLAWRGVTYAPHDNIEIAGQPDHDGIGQFVSWTFKFAGGTNVRQTYDGPDVSLPRLVEPHLGQ
jgi:Putative Flp pilus-assembly TadE/G-like